MQMTLSLTPGLFLWQNGTRSDKPERSGPIASREDALQKEQQRFAACHGTSPEPQQCAGASGGLWELCCLHWQVFREGVTGVMSTEANRSVYLFSAV